MRFLPQFVVSSLSLLTCVSATQMILPKVPNGAINNVKSIHCGDRSYTANYVNRVSLDFTQNHLHEKGLSDYQLKLKSVKDFEGLEPYYSTPLHRSKDISDEVVLDSDGWVVGAITRPQGASVIGPDSYERCQVILELVTWVCFGYEHRDGMKPTFLDCKRAEKS